MKTSVLFMLIVQGTVTVILGILFHKVLTIGKKEKKEKEERENQELRNVSSTWSIKN